MPISGNACSVPISTPAAKNQRESKRPLVFYTLGTDGGGDAMRSRQNCVLSALLAGALSRAATDPYRAKPRSEVTHIGTSAALPPRRRFRAVGILHSA